MFKGTPGSVQKNQSKSKNQLPEVERSRFRDVTSVPRAPGQNLGSLSAIIGYGRNSIIGSLGRLGRGSVLDYWRRKGANYRVIRIGDQRENRALYKKCSNKVYTSKYTPLTLFPLFLTLQFTRFQNVFFLITGLVQLTYPQVPGSRWGIIVPLAGVIFIALIREIVSERKLWKNDEVANLTPIEYVDNGKLNRKPCGNVEVGDILKVKTGELFPADMIILSSSDKEGKCYIETSNMDGEINLKIRQSNVQTLSYNTLESLKYLKGNVITDLPSKSLLSFHGKISVGNAAPDDINLSQTLLRGARLAKTEWVFGFVIYTGHETKLLLNDTKSTIKRTSMDRTLNIQILVLFVYLYLLSTFCSYQSARFTTSNPFAKTFLYDNGSFVSSFFYNIPIFVLLYNNIVPLSLVITCEMLKILLGRYVDNDEDMYYPPAKKFASSRSNWLMEDLGLVNNIFCDKTGTLTCNQIKFRAIYSGNKLYSDCREISNIAEALPLNTMIDIKSFSNVEGYQSLASLIVLLCNEALPTTNDEDPSKIDYITPSVDEEALLVASPSYGLQYFSKAFNVATITHLPTETKTNFKILAVNEFSSFRRRMSVVVKTPTNKIHLYVKGSDESVFSMLDNANRGLESSQTTKKILKLFMTSGYRVLCLAYKEISEKEFDTWTREHTKIKSSCPGGSEIQKSFNEIESNLLLVGFTVSEDKLQDFVPETISLLSKSGIKPWILTGDGRETAINIAKSCKFINQDMPLLECLESKPEEVMRVLKQNVQTFYEMYPPEPDSKGILMIIYVKISRLFGTITNSIFRAISRGFTKLLMLVGYKDKKRMFREHLLYGYGKKKFPDQKYAGLIVIGSCLEAILENDEASRVFLSLAMECCSVVCCSMSPSQKSQVVSLVKNNVKNSVVLAVGDGANDIGMIRAAHIGVGINGLEGTQASKSADFTIYQFHHLTKLIIGHGFRFYYSISSFVLYSFYKNIILYTSQIWYQIYAGFSAQTLYETWSSIASYNLLWMFTQPFIVGVYGRTVTTNTVMRYPSLYKLGHKRAFYNQKKFYRMLINSIITSYLIFYCWVCIFRYGHSSLSTNGAVLNCWAMGIMVFTTILTTVSLESILYILKITYTTILCSMGPVIVFLCAFVLYSKYAPKYLNLSKQIFGLSSIFNIGVFWLGLLLCASARLYVDLLYK